MNQRNDGDIWCSEVLEHLSDYVDGELDASIVSKIEIHLQKCDNCERFGANFGAMVLSIRKLADIDVVSEQTLRNLREAVSKRAE